MDILKRQKETGGEIFIMVPACGDGMSWFLPDLIVGPKARASDPWQPPAPHTSPSKEAGQRSMKGADHPPQDSVCVSSDTQ